MLKKYLSQEDITKIIDLAEEIKNWSYEVIGPRHYENGSSPQKSTCSGRIDYGEFKADIKIVQSGFLRRPYMDILFSGILFKGIRGKNVSKLYRKVKQEYETREKNERDIRLDSSITKLQKFLHS
ncbi:MAG: hypothetical protein Q8P15_00450 [Nanoarchaeota archaeon]|nr:hypothetical protein [Nanoarchaeota archaeon]